MSGTKPDVTRRKPKWSDPIETIEAAVDGLPDADDDGPVETLAKTGLLLSDYAAGDARARAVVDDALHTTGFHDLAHVARYLGGATESHALLYLALRSQAFTLTTD